MKLSLFASLTTVALLSLAGCASAPPVVEGMGDPPRQSTTTPPTPRLQFGQTHTWPNGDTIVVSDPRRKTVNDHNGIDTYIVIDVVVRNFGTVAKSVSGYQLVATHADLSATAVAVGKPGFPEMEHGLIAPGRVHKYGKSYKVNSDSPARFEVIVFGEGLDEGRPPVIFETTI